MDLRTSARRYLPAPVTDALKAAKYRFETWTFAKHVVSHRYGPYEFQMNIDDRVAKEWYDKDWELPPEISFLAQRGLAPGAKVFDLGAHQCLIAIMLAKHIGSEGRVIAVEANEHNVSTARRNIEANKIDNVDVVHALVSDSVGKAMTASSFNSSRVADGDTEIGKMLVDSLTIDEISRRFGRPDVVYVDIEGFEIEALKGARATLAQRCVWFIELHGDAMLSRYRTCNRDVLGFFPSDDFDCHVCSEGSEEFRRLTDPLDLPRERCFTVFTPAAN